MTKKKNTSLIILGLLVLVGLIGGVTYAFMRYVQVGEDNTIVLGDVTFSSSYTAQTKNTVFPIPKSTISTDNNNTAKVSVHIEGTSNYTYGLKYKVLLEDFTNDLGGNMEGPVSITVSSSGISNIELKSYDTGIFGHSGDVIASGTIPKGDSIDGNILVTAFVDSDLVHISDNYYNTASAPRKVIFGTDDWNTFATETGLTFRIRVEAEAIIPEETYVPPVRACTYDGEMVAGATFTDGQYTYKYLQENDAYYDENDEFVDEWYDVDEGHDGWGVAITDRTSTDPVTTPLCTTINNKPIVAMSGMFANSQAPSVDTSSFDTSEVYVMYDMFYNSNIQDADFSHFDTSSVEYFGGMFGASNFEKLDLSSFDTSSARAMQNLFNSSAATEINVSSFDTSNVVNMGGMFYECNTEFLDLRNFDTSNVENMSWMFSSDAIKKFYISSFDTSSVTNMDGMFSYLVVDRLYLHGIDTSSVQQMRGLFEETHVPEVDINSFDTSSLTNIYGMFYDSEIDNIKMKHFDTSGVEYFGESFAEMDYDNLDLSYLDTSSAINLYRMFYNSKFDTLDLSDWDTSNVTSMEDMFKYTDVDVIDISSFDTSSVTNMTRMFEKSKVITIYVSNRWNTSAVTASANMFNLATNLVGGNGTAYSADYANNASLAIVDNRPTQAGYFTYKAY